MKKWEEGSVEYLILAEPGFKGNAIKQSSFSI